MSAQPELSPNERARRAKRARNQSHATWFSTCRNPITECSWCGTKLVWHRLVEPGNRILFDVAKSHLTFLREGAIITLPIASLDHVIPLKDGGSAGLSNVVPSCIPCNTGRDRNPGHVLVCERCGTRKRGKKRMCRPCRLAVHQENERRRAKHNSR